MRAQILDAARARHHRALVHQKDLGPSLRPDGSGMMDSGSGVVDWNNTIGCGKDGELPFG
jgi:hypothetical protein